MKPLMSALTSLILVIIPTATEATCLEDAAAFATRICGEVSNRGSSKLINASGELNAEAKGLVRQVLGSAGGEISTDTNFSSYENVLREQLSAELVNVRQCGTKMAELAMKQVCAKPISFKTCSLPEFGQAGWGGEEVLNGTTGWRGGGYNPDAYCSDFSSAVINSRNIGGQQYKIEILGKSEEARWRGSFNRHREYNYHCSVKLLWNPIYNSRTDERCGVID